MKTPFFLAALVLALNGCVAIPISNDGTWKGINGGDASISRERNAQLRQYLKLNPHSPEGLSIAKEIGQAGDGALVAHMAKLYGKRRMYPVIFPVSHVGIAFFSKTNPYANHADHVVAAIRNPAAAPALRALIERGAMKTSAIMALKASGVPLTDADYQTLFVQVGYYADWDALIDEINSLPPDRASKIFLTYFHPNLIHHETMVPWGTLSIGQLIACNQSKVDTNMAARAIADKNAVVPLTDKEFARLTKIIGFVKHSGYGQCLVANLPALSAADVSERGRMPSTSTMAANYPEELTDKSKRASQQLEYLIAEVKK